jgi:hypothetical protein
MRPTQSIEYWRALWIETVARVKLVDPGLQFAAPAYVLHDLADELKLTRLEREHVRQGYAELVKSSQHRPIIRKEYEAEFESVQESITRWKGWQYALHQVNSAIDAMKGSYGHATAVRLARLLEQTTLEPKARNEVAELTNDMIVALLVAGHSLKFIAAIPDHLLDGYKYIGDHFVTKFPHGLDRRKCEDFETEVRLIIDGLSPIQRLAKIEEYFAPRTSKRRYIFQLRGLRIAASLELGDATLYNPLVVSKVSPDSPWKPDEAFRQEEATDFPFPNIAVLIDCDERDDAAADYHAVKTANQYLDLIKTQVTQTSVLRVATDEHFVTDESWRCLSSSGSSANDERVVQMTGAPDLPLAGREDAWNEFLIRQGQPHLVGPKTDAARRLSQALHVHRRGAEATRHDDKLTHHWVVLETLLPIQEWKSSGAAKQDESATGLIRRVLPALFVRRFLVYDVGWRLHRLLRSLIRAECSWPPQLVLSQALVERCQLGPPRGGKLYLSEVLQGLPELLLEIPVDTRLRERVQETISFYAEPNVAYARIRECSEHCRATVDRIYRARNRVVHDTVSEVPLLEALADYSADVSRVLLYEAIRNIGKKTSLSDILLLIEAQIDGLQAKLRKGQQVDLLELPDPEAC